MISIFNPSIQIHFIFIKNHKMGRRAKNKQGPPQPLQAGLSNNAKRKASEEAASRPNKKLKDVSNNSKSLSPSKSKLTVPNGKGRPRDIQEGKKPQKVQFQEGEDKGSSEDGWEDIDEADEIELRTQRYNPYIICAM